MIITLYNVGTFKSKLDQWDFKCNCNVVEYVLIILTIETHNMSTFSLAALKAINVSQPQATKSIKGKNYTHYKNNSSFSVI